MAKLTDPSRPVKIDNHRLFNCLVECPQILKAPPPTQYPTFAEDVRAILRQNIFSNEAFMSKRFLEILQAPDNLYIISPKNAEQKELFHFDS